jgi:hypothetical protein
MTSVDVGWVEERRLKPSLRRTTAGKQASYNPTLHLKRSSKQVITADGGGLKPKDKSFLTDN